MKLEGEKYKWRVRLGGQGTVAHLVWSGSTRTLCCKQRGKGRWIDPLSANWDVPHCKQCEQKLASARAWVEKFERTR